MKAIRAKQRVRLKRNITRSEGPYAKAGDEGVVIDTFVTNVHQYHDGSIVRVTTRTWYAKVLMDGAVKTFRLTSLEGI